MITIPGSLPSLSRLGSFLPTPPQIDRKDLSKWLSEVSKRTHPYFHPFQVTLQNTFTCIGAKCFSSMPLLNVAAVTSLAYVISQYTTPIIASSLEAYRDDKLIILVGQLANISLPLCTANTVCSLVGKSIRINQVPYLVVFVMLGTSGVQLVLKRIR